MQEAVVTQVAAGAGARPTRAEIEPAVLSLLARHSAGLLATARRYSATPEDAEDAYQRGVEILLTKAPTAAESELLPWLRTVVKHEAFAVAKSNGRAVPAANPREHESDDDAWTDERAERYERLRVAAEAMAGLKPQEIRCLVLKAEGLSYQEICRATAFSYTKVNRCIAEGRRAFLKRIAAIESGAECERLQPAISRFVDGEASASELRIVRAHLKTCLTCRATLREYRATPSRLAGLVPPVVALAGAPGGGGFGGLVTRLVVALQDRIGIAADGAGTQKAAAIVASAAVLAGGGAAGVRALGDAAPPAVHARAAAAAPAAGRAPSASSAPAAAQLGSPQFVQHGALLAAQSTTTTSPKTAPDAASAADPGPEFDPGTSGGGSRDRAAPAERSPPPPASAPSASPPSSGSGSPSGEFMP
jgi:RNA polymerase sigma factor (sigma-70 family)